MIRPLVVPPNFREFVEAGGLISLPSMSQILRAGRAGTKFDPRDDLITAKALGFRRDLDRLCCMQMR